MSAWTKPPSDATVRVEQVCYCGTAAAQCDLLCSSNGKPPSGYFRIVASGTWTPPVPVRLLLEQSQSEQSETIRVR